MKPGLNTALVTPMKDTGRSQPDIDFSALRYLINDCIDAKHDSIVVAGTTGESPTLNFDEHILLIDKAIDFAEGKIMVVAHIGSNSTREAIELTEEAVSRGADALMAVVPYYNKPTEAGLFKHFEAIKSAASGRPLCAYDIKPRTGIQMSADLIIKLANEGIIDSLKAASGDTEQEDRVIAETSDDFLVLAGDDSRVLDLYRRGGDGVVSVISNLLRNEMAELVNYLRNSNFIDGGAKLERLLPAMNAMFLETNPIPVKTALWLAEPQVFKPQFRLPLCQMTEENLATLKRVLCKYLVLS